MSRGSEGLIREISYNGVILGDGLFRTSAFIQRTINILVLHNATSVLRSHVVPRLPLVRNELLLKWKR